MSPSLDMGEGLSLRHLPDTSDASFSFQIPTSTRGDYLLADDGEDFFKGAEDILATPVPPRFTLDSPLTLSQLTPRPSDGTSSKFTLSSQQRHSRGPETVELDQAAHQRTPVIKARRTNTVNPQPRAITRVAQPFGNLGASPAGERIDNLRAQVNSLSDELVTIQETIPSNSRKSDMSIPLPTDGMRPKKASTERQKESVIHARSSGERTRRRATTGTTVPLRKVVTTVSRHELPSEDPPHKPLDGASRVKPDTSGDAAALGGIAKRLLMYNEQINTAQDAVGKISKAPNKPGAFSQVPLSPAEIKRSCASSEPSSSTDSLLTLSQLSPQKPRSESRDAVSSPDISVPKPLSSSSIPKRPASRLSDDSRIGKKAKRTVLSTAGGCSTSSLNNKSSAVVSRRRESIRRRLSGSRSKPNAMGLKSKARSTTSGAMGETSRRTKPRSLKISPSESETRAALSPTGVSSTSSHQSGRDSHLHNHTKITSPSSSSLSRLAPEQEGSRRASTFTKKTVVRATIPHEFRFHVDARLEARKSESEKPDSLGGESSNLRKLKRSIPDFKVLHAAHDAELAHRKENIHPVVPHPIKFETDARMKERQKFEEKIREKELERHLELERKRRERLEQEEREIQEMRRQAVPKANEVPEWYRDAPKKATRQRS